MLLLQLGLIPRAPGCPITPGCGGCRRLLAEVHVQALSGEGRLQAPAPSPCPPRRAPQHRPMPVARSQRLPGALHMPGILPDGLVQAPAAPRGRGGDARGRRAGAGPQAAVHRQWEWPVCPARPAGAGHAVVLLEPALRGGPRARGQWHDRLPLRSLSTECQRQLRNRRRSRLRWSALRSKGAATGGCYLPRYGRGVRWGSGVNAGTAASRDRGVHRSLPAAAAAT
mmetsp:Transcript_99153/g.289345  ORF Transcript_99153/g.289345 Transcript_99153/m.289345 type:complete len:226 (-) Transcript_99153:755-1432(-)